MSALESELNELSWRDLQARCRDKGLIATGKKTELVQRLLEADQPAPLSPPRKDVGGIASLSEVGRTLSPIKVKISESADLPVRKTISKEGGNVAFGSEMLKLSESERRALRAQRFALSAVAPLKEAVPVRASAEDAARLAARAARFGATNH